MKFRKSDLKDGDIVTYRNSEKRTVRGNRLMYRDETYANNLSNYTEELKDKDKVIEFDIIKVERPIGYETVFERKEEILDEAEKRYLRGVIRPFRSKIKFIMLYKYSTKEVYLLIKLDEGDRASLPNFKVNAMYKNMEINKEYTLEELGL